MAIEDYWEITNKLHGIGPVAFKEICEQYYKSEEWIERKEKEYVKQKNINLNYCVDFMNDRYMCGEKYVYGWRNQYGELIYIGQGELERSLKISKTARSTGFNEHSDGKLYLYFFAKRVSKKTAIEIEKMLIQRCCLNGIEIENTKEILTKWEAKYFKRRIKELPVEENKAIEKLYNDYEDSLLQYEEVVKKFDMFLKNIKNNKRVVENEFVKPYKEDRKTYWTIGGVTKPAMDWCAEYGRSYSNVMYRVKNHGITLEQALTLPNVQYTKSKGNAMNQWKTMGLL